MTSPEDPPESLPSPISRARRTHRTRAKRGAPRFLGRASRLAELASSTPPPVSVDAGPPPGDVEPAPLPPEERPFDEADERFFLAEDSLAPTAIALSEPDADEEAEPAPATRLASPRRRAFARYVGVVVMLAAGMCVAAFTRHARHPVAAGASEALPRPAAAAPKIIAAPANAPPPPVPFAAERAGAIIDPVAALASRERARAALSKGDVASAVTLGTESVELDPTDAEAWLVLGAAEMAAGQHGPARSTFTACTKVATRGPRHECGQMLQ